MRRVGLTFSSSIFAVFACVTGCLGTQDTGRFSYLVGSRFRSVEAGYFFNLAYNKVPFVGRYDLAYGARVLPHAVDARYVGAASEGLAIVGIVPAGTNFTVTGISEDVSTIGDIVSFRCRIDSPGYEGKVLDMRFAQRNIDGSRGLPPEIDHANAVQV